MIKILTLLLLLTTFSFAQRPDISNFTKVGVWVTKDGNTQIVFLVDNKNATAEKSIVTFDALQSTKFESQDDFVLVSPENFSVARFKADCWSHKSAIISIYSVTDGKEAKAEYPEKWLPKPDINSPIEAIISVVCREKLGVQL